jgi:hypothetical protein
LFAAFHSRLPISPLALGACQPYFRSVEIKLKRYNSRWLSLAKCVKYPLIRRWSLSASAQ